MWWRGVGASLKEEKFCNNLHHNLMDLVLPNDCNQIRDY